MAARKWTPEQRERQRQAIQAWRPWEHSTGPRTPDGKAKTCRNGWKGGTRPALRELARALETHRRTACQSDMQP